LLHLNEEFHLNILFIYVTTPILLMIFSLRGNTHGKQYFNKNWHKETHINIMNTPNYENFQMYSNVSLQSFTLRT
jgi:hypothetical protein